MDILKHLFRSNEKQPVTTIEEFWMWFQKHQLKFFNIVSTDGNIQDEFLGKLTEKFKELDITCYFITGMPDEHTVELILSAEGDVRYFDLLEEITSKAPNLNNWKFIALKPALDIGDIQISMEGFQFNKDKISFYASDFPEYPDEVDLIVTHDDFTTTNSETIINGTYLFLEHYLGELNFAADIDGITILSPADAQKELIPIEKLKEYLKWRETEFVEKYQGVYHDAEHDKHSVMEATIPDSGRKMIAVINTQILEWDSKASHPWVLRVVIKYNGDATNGMPDDTTTELMNKAETEMELFLKDYDGYIYIGRQTGDNSRIIFFVCKEFRRPAKVMRQIVKDYIQRLDIHYDIYKDKYWQSFRQYS